MNIVIHPLLADSKTVFAKNLPSLTVSEGCVAFNAPRPLLGTEIHYSEWLHGRFYTELDPSAEFSAGYIKGNNALDARIVLQASDEELVEILLMDNKWADGYREFTLQQQLDMLLPKLSKIQGLPYPEAVALLDAAKTLLKPDAD